MSFAALPDDWARALAGATGTPEFEGLSRFLDAQRRSAEVFPAEDDVFAAFHLTPVERVRVVILGQDPYHGEGQAHGLAFSVPPEQRIPPSLRNIFRELQDDLGAPSPASGDLRPWAQRGVLLLNTVLTVRAGEANSHRKRGWEGFTDAVIETISARPHPAVFVLWGRPAQRKARLIDLARHRVIEGPHPSPLSAHRGFFGSRPFTAVNEALVALGHDPRDWTLTATT